MKKISLYILLLLSFLGVNKVNADIQITSIPAEGVLQTSTTNFYWIADHRANNSFGVKIYDKNGSLTSLGYTLSGFGENITPGNANVYHKTLNIDDYYIIFTLCNASSKCDNYTTYTIIKKSTETKVASGWLGGNGGGTPSYALIGDYIIFSTTSGIKTLQLSTGVWTNGNATTYTNMNALQSVGGGRVRGTSTGVGSYYTSSYDDNGLTKYTINYIEWGEVDSTTFGLVVDTPVFETSSPINDFRLFGPYTNGIFLSYSTGGPFNFVTDTETATNVDYEVFTYTKETWNDNFWKHLNQTTGIQGIQQSMIYNMFVANSQFYYVQDTSLTDFNYDVGPLVGYELSAGGDIDSVYYIDNGVLFKKTDTASYSGSIDTDNIDTGNTQGTTGTGGLYGTGSVSGYEVNGIFDTDLDGDGETSITEALKSIFLIPARMFAVAGDYIQILKDFVDSFLNQEEPTFKNILTFELIPSANAGFFGELIGVVEDREDTPIENKTPIQKYTGMLKYGLYFLIIVFLISLYIVNKKHND